MPDPQGRLVTRRFAIITLATLIRGWKSESAPDFCKQHRTNATQRTTLTDSIMLDSTPSALSIFYEDS